MIQLFFLIAEEQEKQKRTMALVTEITEVDRVVTEEEDNNQDSLIREVVDKVCCFSFFVEERCYQFLSFR